MNDELIETLEETEINLRFPSKVSQLENDLNYQTDTQVAATVATETSAREAADQSLASDIASEATTRTNADAALSTRITANTNAITDEVTARQNADTNLQGQIDAITASSDVTDIVGTYAQLQAYDTSTLGNNDIIKVLQDEQHAGETTYYRWSTTTQTFTLIGEEGPYYTKSAADAKFSTKAYVDQKIGDIESALQTLNSGTGAQGA